MVRVLRPGGQVGVTTWGVAPNPVAQLWKDVAAEFVSLDELQAAFREVIPWDEWFSQAANLRQALKDANLVSARITRRNYVVTMNVTDYLAVKETAVEGTLMRRSLMADQWTAFKQRVAAVFQDRFPDTVEYVRDVYFGIGMKRAA